MSDNPKHTPGPSEAWASLCVGCGPNVAVDGDDCCGGCGGTAVGSWLHDNGRLFAAAPELAALLDEAYEECDDWQDWKRRARAALKRAGLR